MKEACTSARIKKEWERRHAVKVPPKIEQGDMHLGGQSTGSALDLKVANGRPTCDCGAGPPLEMDFTAANVAGERAVKISGVAPLEKQALEQKVVYRKLLVKYSFKSPLGVSMESCL